MNMLTRIKSWFLRPTFSPLDYNEIARVRGLEIIRSTAAHRAICTDPINHTGENNDEDECEGHESLNGADMGSTVYCDGSCL